jgi:pimeloyl-ACP methyl ester carboxylesterase
MKDAVARRKTTIRERCMRTGLLCFGIYAIACAGCATCQRRLLYFPPVFKPEQVDEMGKFERMERWLGPQGTQLGWKRLAPTQPPQGRVLLMHGNAGCAFQCGRYANVLQQAAPLDLFVVEYPGYADRAGKPSERAIYEAAAEAFEQLPTNGPTCLLGESLGTGVAAYLAGRFPDKVAGIIMLAPFNRLAAVAQAHYPFLPVRLLLVERFPAEDHLRNYHGPVAMLVGGQDRVIPQKFGRRLYDGYSGPKRLWEFPRADHGAVMDQPVEIWKELIAFLEKPH